jgi:hypothetical protein
MFTGAIVVHSYGRHAATIPILGIPEGKFKSARPPCPRFHAGMGSRHSYMATSLRGGGTPSIRAVITSAFLELA